MPLPADEAGVCSVLLVTHAGLHPGDAPVGHGRSAVAAGQWLDCCRQLPELPQSLDAAVADACCAGLGCAHGGCMCLEAAVRQQ